MNNITDEYFKDTIGGSRENFIEFVTINWPEILDKNHPRYGEVEDLDGHIDRLAHRVAKNLYYFKQNTSTAKSDFICLLALLMRKGVVFEKHEKQKT